MEEKLTPFEQKIIDTFLEVMQTSENGESILLASPDLACQMMTEVVIVFEMNNAHRQGFKFHQQTSLEIDVLANLERLFLSGEEANIILARQIIKGLDFSETSLLNFLGNIYQAFITKRFIQSFDRYSLSGNIVGITTSLENGDKEMLKYLYQAQKRALLLFVLPIFLSS